MLINGKEIIYSAGEAENIQLRLNKNDYVDPLIKGIDTQKKEKEDRDKRSGYGNFELVKNGFQGVSSSAGRAEDYQKYRSMAKTVFIRRALEIVSDDATQPNMEGDVLKVDSNDSKIKERLTDLFLFRLDMDRELWSIFYETVQMGDNFYELIPDSYKHPTKIVAIRYLEPDKVERVEKNGNLKFFLYRNDEYKSQKKQKEDRFEDEPTVGMFKLQPWQIVHFKIEDKEQVPYGGSLLKSAIKPFDYLSLLEDVMLIYRISRSPERRVFYIDVGNLSPTEAKQFLQQLKTHYRSESILDENGKLNKRANVLSITSDIFVPQRNGQGTRIEPLAGGEALANTDDIKYFRDQIIKAINVSPDYLGESSDRSRGSLSQLDIKTGRFIQRIQSQITSGLNKIACIDLFFGGFKKYDLSEFQIIMSPPSNIKELTDISLIDQRMNLIATIIGLNIFPTRWILKNIMKFSDKEISDILLYKKVEDDQKASEREALGAGAEGQPPMGGGAPAGGAGLDMAGTSEIASGAADQGSSLPVTAPTGAFGSGAAPAGMPESTMISVLGKEFILENKNDFFKIVNYLKEDVPEAMGKHYIVESISDFITKDFRKGNGKIPVKKFPNNYNKLWIINEFGGINFSENKFKLYEKTEDPKTKQITEKEVIYSLDGEIESLNG